MGGGTREKINRLNESHRCDSEYGGLRTIVLLLFATLVLFLLNSASDLIIHTDEESLALAARLKKERNHRLELKRQEEEAVNKAADLDQLTLLSRDDMLPAWVTPRASKKKKKSANSELEEEWGEEDAELELRVQMSEWLREVGTLPPSLPSEGFEQLRKRQQYVEQAIEEVIESRLEDLPFVVLVTRSPTPDTAVEHQAEAQLHTRPVPAHIASVRKSNLYASITVSKYDEAFETTLHAMGYMQGSNKPPLPMWIISFGAKCPADSDLHLDRHGLVCPFYLPGAAAGKHLAAHAYARPSKVVFSELLSRSGHKHDGPALASALAEVFDSTRFHKPSYRLNNAKDQAGLEAALAREAEKRPVFVMWQNDGASSPQLTDNVAALLANQKKVVGKQLILKPYVVDNLWDNRKFVLRSWVVVFGSNPLLALYTDGTVLRASEAYKKPAPVESAPAAAHFPGSSATSTRLTLKDAVQAGVVPNSEAWMRKRMKQIAAFVALSAGLAAAPEAPMSRVAVQHLCVDFVVDDARHLWVDAVKISCPPEARLVEPVLAIAEEMLMRRSKQEAVEFGLLASYPDAVNAGLELLVDEARERTAGRSLLDALESLVPPPM